MSRAYDPMIKDNYGIAGRIGRGAATLALRGVLITVLGATLVTARAVEPLREGNVRQRVKRRVRDALPSFAR